ncbi:MAG: DUF2461 domain-containing protein [Bacteroidaceae bacterium]|nr:DUF2461 domain-containing protein [Bacteroidaceae bacterium]
METREIMAFLTELSCNNNKEWFHANKPRYQAVKRAVDELAAELLEAVGAFDETIGRQTPADCVFRIYRDIRFAKDKSPYKTHFGMFVARGGRNSCYNGYYFQMGADGGEHIVAVGNYFLPPAALTVLREDIQMGEGDFREILSRVDPRLQMNYTDSLKRTPRGFPSEGPDAAFYKLKSFGLWYRPEDDFITAPCLVGRLAEMFKTAKPFVDYINRAIDYSLGN